jgi:CHASE2 domain-containing sensor protein
LRQIILPAFFKAIAATLLFILAYIFYQSELIRGMIEDTAFDTVNKFVLATVPAKTQSPQVMIFAFDDLYMRSNKLIDESNSSNYGYLFSRENIALFIERLDSLSREMAPEHRPAALFIDYDMQFASMPGGHILSDGDQRLIEVLGRDRPYRILLPDNGMHNFVRESCDPAIRRAIETQRLVFVSVGFKRSNDGAVRRYQGFQTVGDEERVHAAVALWQIARRGHIDLSDAHKYFERNDIVANRMMIKLFRQPHSDDDCIIARSYWEHLTQYSTQCSFYDVIEEDFSGSLLLLGATHALSSDFFHINGLPGTEQMAGVQLHANTLMTMFLLDGKLGRLSLGWSAGLIFVSFFSLSVLIAFGLKWIGIEGGSIEFFLLLVIVSMVLFGLSVYLLWVHHLWFNWLIALLLYEAIELIEDVREFLPDIRLRFRRRG